MDSEPTNFQDLHLDERAYKFFPLHQEQKHNFNKPNGTRVYFHGQIEHDDFEKKKLAEFQEYLKTKQGNKYDQKYFNPHMLVLFLSSNNYKNQQTFQAMNQHIQFVRKYVRDEKGNRIIRYETDEKVRKLVDAGFFYVCGRDHHFRPTIVFNLPKTDTKDTDAVLRGIVFVQEEVIEKMFIPGQVESWNIIYDLGGMGLTDIPVNALKGAIQTISANYGGRLYKLWMLNAPGTIYFSWKVVKNFLDPVTADKIHIIKKNTDDHLWKLFHKNQIEQKYGGTQPNRTKFYPFKIPKADPDISRLISDEKYAHMVESGFLKNNVIDPKYTNKKAKEEEEKKEKIKQEELKKQEDQKKEEQLKKEAKAKAEREQQLRQQERINELKRKQEEAAKKLLEQQQTEAAKKAQKTEVNEPQKQQQQPHQQGQQVKNQEVLAQKQPAQKGDAKPEEAETKVEQQ